MPLQEEPAGQDIVGPPLFLRGGLLLVLNGCGLQAQAVCQPHSFFP